MYNQEEIKSKDSIEIVNDVLHKLQKENRARLLCLVPLWHLRAVAAFLYHTKVELEHGVKAME
jgi:hypothetical protein